MFFYAIMHTGINMKATFNNLINLEYPEGYKELTLIENKKYFSGNLLRITFHNEEKHILLSLSKGNDSFINRFISVATVVSGSLSNLSKNLKDYEFIEQFESSICGKDAIHECFSYTANDEDIKQYGELSVFKMNKAFYVVYCICRYSDKEECQKIFKEYRDSFSVD